MFYENKPEGMAEDKWKVLHRQTCDFIRLWVGENVLNHVSTKTSARTLWLKLEQLFARKEGVNKMLLIRRLMQLRHSDNRAVADHVNELQGVVNELLAMGITFEDEVRALILLG